MSNSTSLSQEYLKNTVMTATPEQLQLMLYDGAVRFATRGWEALQNGDREGAFNALERAQRIVLELGSGLRREVNPALADQMAALYNFVHRRLVDANLRQDAQAVADALRILRHQRETWVMLMHKLHGDARPLAPAVLPEKPAKGQAQPSSFVTEG